MKNKFLARRFKVGTREERHSAEEGLGSEAGPDLVGGEALLTP